AAWVLAKGGACDGADAGARRGAAFARGHGFARAQRKRGGENVRGKGDAHDAFSVSVQVETSCAGGPFRYEKRRVPGWDAALTHVGVTWLRIRLPVLVEVAPRLLVIEVIAAGTLVVILARVDVALPAAAAAVAYAACIGAADGADRRADRRAGFRIAVADIVADDRACDAAEDGACRGAPLDIAGLRAGGREQQRDRSHEGLTHGTLLIELGCQRGLLRSCSAGAVLRVVR